MATSEPRVVGKSLPRMDGAGKVTGTAVYAADFALPGMLVGKVSRSTEPHARIVRVDTARARALPGVRAVMTAADVPDVRYGGALKDETVFARGKVRYVGQPVAAVAATTREAAEAALAAIEVVYAPLPAVLDLDAALAPGAPLIHEEWASYTAIPILHRAVADVAVAMEDRNRRVARPPLVDQRGAGRQRGVEIEDGGQRLVDDLDGRQRGFRGLARRRRHGRHRLADISHLAPGEHRLVLEGPAVADVGHVGGGHHRAHSGQSPRPRCVQAHDARVRLRAAEHLADEHAGQREVRGVDGGAGNLPGAVHARERLADDPGLAGGHRSPPGRAVADDGEDRFGNLLVAGAAAKIPRERRAHVVLGGRRVLVQVGLGGEDHAGDAVAALHRAVVDEGALERMELPIAREPLDREHRTPLALRGQEDARVHGRAVEQDGAHAALRLQTVLLRPGEAEVGAQDVEKRAVRLGEDLVPLTVDRQRQGKLAHDACSRARSTQRARTRGTSVSTRRRR